jgi:hypothetical protein
LLRAVALLKLSVSISISREGKILISCIHKTVDVPPPSHKHENDLHLCSHYEVSQELWHFSAEIEVFDTAAGLEGYSGTKAKQDSLMDSDLQDQGLAESHGITDASKRKPRPTMT